MKVLQSPQIVQFFLILGLVFSSVGGLVVAAILKKLDNVVKVNNFILSYKIWCRYFQEYSYSTANMFTAVICAFLFPDKFEITVFIILSMAFLFCGIFFYEKKHLNQKPTTSENSGP